MPLQQADGVRKKPNRAPLIGREYAHLRERLAKRFASALKANAGRGFLVPLALPLL